VFVIFYLLIGGGNANPYQTVILGGQMYTLEEKTRAVELYVRYGRKVAMTTPGKR